MASQDQTEQQDKKEDRPAAGIADPLQWWSALSQQFQQIAAQAMQEAAQRATPPADRSAADKAPADNPANKAPENGTIGTGTGCKKNQPSCTQAGKKSGKEKGCCRQSRAQGHVRRAGGAQVKLKA